MAIPIFDLQSAILDPRSFTFQLCVILAASHRAVRNKRASLWRGPTSCTPIGKPLTLCSSGKVMHGMPHSVHSVQNAGSPVEARPFGAALGAAGVKIAS